MAGRDHRVDLAQHPSVSHLLETSIYVQDLGKAHDFYRRVFSFDLIFEDDRMVALKLPSSAILLLFAHGGSLSPSETLGGMIPPHGATGAAHLCFAIPQAALQTWIDHLQEQAVPLESTVTQYFGGISLYFRDPDGNSLEVATPGLWPNY